MWRALLLKTAVVMIGDASSADVTRCWWTTVSENEKWQQKFRKIEKSKFRHLQCAVRKGLSRVTLITCQITNSQGIGTHEKSAKGQNENKMGREKKDTGDATSSDLSDAIDTMRARPQFNSQDSALLDRFSSPPPKKKNTILISIKLL